MLASIEKIDALVAGITKAEIQRMPPAHRQRLAQVLRYIADLADPPKPHSPMPAYSPISETVSGGNDIRMRRDSHPTPERPTELAGAGANANPALPSLAGLQPRPQPLVGQAVVSVAALHGCPSDLGDRCHIATLELRLKTQQTPRSRRTAARSVR